ncbi:MAG: acyl-CoA dehydrogenase family protein [Gammaproteobacteria bacterium]
MDLRIDPKYEAFRAEVRDFVAASLPADIRARVTGFLRVEREDYVRWQRILHARGWGAPLWPVEYGGTGWDAMQRIVFEEECFKAGAPRQLPFGLVMCGPVLMEFGSPEQRARFLPPMRSGDVWWCQGYSEPGAGSDLASLKTRAERRGDRYVVNGQKIWTTYAHWADWMFCLVRTRADGKPQDGISFLLLDMKSKGVSVKPIITLDQGHDVNQVFLDDVEVPVENLVGAEHSGWTIAKFLLGNERTSIAGVGWCMRLLGRLREVARAQAGNGRPLVDDPRFRDKLARVEIDFMSHYWSLMRMISLERSGKPIGAQASILKIRGSELQQDITELLMECAGPYALPYLPEALEIGWTGDTAGGMALNPLAGVYFDYRKASIYGGSNEIQKNIIAKMMLGL